MRGVLGPLMRRPCRRKDPRSHVSRCGNKQSGQTHAAKISEMSQSARHGLPTQRYFYQQRRRPLLEASFKSQSGFAKVWNRPEKGALAEWALGLEAWCRASLARLACIGPIGLGR